MKKIKKIIFSILSTICVLFFFTLDSYASTTSSVKGIIIDERMQKREELESSYDMYGCYTTGWWGKEHHHEALIARIQTACGVYDYYNKDEDTITVYCYSWMRSNLADNVRVRQNRSSQNIRLYMPNGNLNGSYSPGEVLPSTKYRDITETISTGVQFEYCGGDLSIIPTYNYSTSYTNNELSFNISSPTGDDKCDEGYQWDFSINGGRNSLYTNTVTYTFVITNASTHFGESVDVRFGYWHEYTWDGRTHESKGHPNDKNIQSCISYKIKA